MAWRCRCTLLLDSPVRSAKLRMLCWPYSRIALKMTILLAHNPMGSVRALKGGCNWKNQLFRVRDRPPVVPLYVDARNLAFPLLKPFCKLFWASQQQCFELVHLYVRDKPLILDFIG